MTPLIDYYKDVYIYRRRLIADDFKFGTPLTHDMISKFNASIQPQRMIAESIAAEQDCMMRQVQEVGEQGYQYRKRVQEAMERTAHNTDVTNERLEKMIDQQSSYIELLEKANETLQKQLETGQKQLEILQDIFASGEDGILVEKELMNLIKKEIDETLLFGNILKIRVEILQWLVQQLDFLYCMVLLRHFFSLKELCYRKIVLTSTQYYT